MVNQTNIEKLFDVLDESAIILYERYKLPYLEGLIKTCENIISDSVNEDFTEKSEILRDKLDRLKDIEFQKEEIRKAFQYACLKGFKHKNITNQMITPDSIGIFLSYLIDKLYLKKKLTILDPLVGTGNLITTIANQREDDVNLIGVDNEMNSYMLSQALFDMLGYGDKVFYQDTLTYSGPESDVIVTDFSGIEMDEIFKIIKHQRNNIADNGFLMGIIDNNFFDDDKLSEFINEVKQEWHFFGLVVLPKQFFKYHGKSILILQNIGEGFIKPKTFMMAEIPSFEKKEEMLKVINRLNQWFKDTEFKRVGDNNL